MKQYNTMTDFAPKQFTNKDGQQFITREHYATFNDKHNASRAKVYMLLFDRLVYRGIKEGLSVGELHRATGTNYNYIKARISKWVAWGFLQRETTIVNGRPVFAYSIDERGKHFVTDIIPEEWLKEYARQLRG